MKRLNLRPEFTNLRVVQSNGVITLCQVKKEGDKKVEKVFFTLSSEKYEAQDVLISAGNNVTIAPGETLNNELLGKLSNEVENAEMPKVSLINGEEKSGVPILRKESFEIIKYPKVTLKGTGNKILKTYDFIGEKNDKIRGAVTAIEFNFLLRIKEKSGFAICLFPAGQGSFDSYAVFESFSE